LAAWGYYLVHKYLKTSDTAYLRSIGNYVLLLTLPAVLAAGSEAQIFPEKSWLVYVTVLVGALAGLALKAAHYQGWRKLIAVVSVVIYVAAVSFLVSSLNYFHGVILAAHSVKTVSALVPEAQGHIENLSPERKAEVGAKLAAQLSSPDRFARIGALVRLQAIPEAIPAAVPAMAAAIPTCDEDALEILFGMLQRLGPAAADAVPAVEARLASLPSNSRAAYRAQDALKAIKVIPGTASGQ
jgi:hypothetical protein